MDTKPSSPNPIAGIDPSRDPSNIPAFHDAMRALIQVPKSEMPTDKRKGGKPKKRK
jgi:hypothetical protein